MSKITSTILLALSRVRTALASPLGGTWDPSIPQYQIVRKEGFSGSGVPGQWVSAGDTCEPGNVENGGCHVDQHNSYSIGVIWSGGAVFGLDIGPVVAQITGGVYFSTSTTSISGVTVDCPPSNVTCSCAMAIRPIYVLTEGYLTVENVTQDGIPLDKCTNVPPTYHVFLPQKSSSNTPMFDHFACNCNNNADETTPPNRPFDCDAGVPDTIQPTGAPYRPPRSKLPASFSITSIWFFMKSLSTLCFYLPIESDWNVEIS